MAASLTAEHTAPLTFSFVCLATWLRDTPKALVCIQIAVKPNLVTFGTDTCLPICTCKMYLLLSQMVVSLLLGVFNYVVSFGVQPYFLNM